MQPPPPSPGPPPEAEVLGPNPLKVAPQRAFSKWRMHFLPQSGKMRTPARFGGHSATFHSCTCTPARFWVPTLSFCLRVEIFHTFGPSALSFGPKVGHLGPECAHQHVLGSDLACNVRFACHVRAHQHVLASLHAFCASEWNFARTFGPSARTFGPSALSFGPKFF
jgi:hypothetical protein